MFAIQKLVEKVRRYTKRLHFTESNKYTKKIKRTRRILRMLTYMQVGHKKERSKNYRYWTNYTKSNADYIIQSTRIAITATLNTMHELQGHEYRHNVKEQDAYGYKKMLGIINEMLEQESDTIFFSTYM